METYDSEAEAFAAGDFPSVCPNCGAGVRYRMRDVTMFGDRCRKYAPILDDYLHCSAECWRDDLEGYVVAIRRVPERPNWAYIPDAKRTRPASPSPFLRS